MVGTIVVAGATGSVGRALIRVAQQGGWRTRALGRDAGRLATCGADECHAVSFGDAAELRGVIQPGDVVFSSLGASASPSPFMGYSTYSRVDVPNNIALIEAARQAGAARFMYVSLAFGRELRDYAFAGAHEAVVDAVLESGLPYTILRPTGIFSTFRRLWGFAKLGLFPVPGLADAKSNPIHEEDIASNALASIGKPNCELDMGGPEVLTRREMGEILMRAAGQPNGRIVHTPDWFHLACAYALWPISPRACDMLKFYLAISKFDNVAPVMGRQRLVDYYAARAQQSPSILGGMHRSGW
jgi:uncharacterized protein YbjT (DUF2867 family)